MDAFYASVEQRDNPSLRGKAIAVGSPGPRGVVLTASYEARRYGVGSAMPSVIAQQRCPDLIFVPARHDVYRAVSQELRALMKAYTDLIEPLSLDEAYLDVTSPKQGPHSATLLAKQLKQDIKTRTHLTASAGVASNKFLAKIASGQQKPDGLTIITPDRATAFIEALAIERFFGVGPVTAKRMHALGVRTGADLKKLSEAQLVAEFGKQGRHFWLIARGEDNRPVEANRQRKSIGAETTFSQDYTDKHALALELPPLVNTVVKHLNKHKLHAGGVTLKLKFSDHQVITRRQALITPTSDSALLHQHAKRLLLTRVELGLPVRLLGVSVYDLRTQQGVHQPGLFETT